MPQRASYDALMLVSFGGPEGPDDVMPFLQRVTAGRNIPAARLELVAEQYASFGGVSPINQNNRDLLAALSASLEHAGITLPLYWGNRNWHPLLTDTVRQIESEGHRSVLAIVTSAFGSYSGCRQYSEDLSLTINEAGAGLSIQKARLYWNHPGFLGAMTARTVTALASLDPEQQRSARLVFTAHSIPASWTSTSPYVAQLASAAQYVAERSGMARRWDLTFQSRSGPPSIKWLEPDVGDHLRSLNEQGTHTVVVVPLGFVSDHMEVLYDLDILARGVANDLGMTMVRAQTPGVHPDFVAALRDLVVEAIDGTDPLSAVGEPWPNPCAEDCCLKPQEG